MTTTDPTITIAGLRAQVESLIESIGRANSQCASFCDIIDESRSVVARVESERDALAAQLAEVRAELAAAPKVCAIHSYALEGPCMTCGSPWPGAEKALCQERIEGMEKMRRISAAVGCPNSVEEVVEAVAAIKSDLASERAHLAACQTRIAGLEQAADERSAEVARLTEERDEALKHVAWLIEKERSAGWATVKAENQRAINAEARVSELEAERTEWIAASVAIGEHVDHLGPVASGGGDIAPREWIHYAQSLAGRVKARIGALTARVAELEARPVLTAQSLCDALVHARAAGDFLHVPAAVAADVASRIVTGGPVTLPAQDRAEDLTQAIHGTPREEVNPAMWRGMVERTRSALASLGAPPTSPTAARPVFAGVSASDLDVAYIGGQRECHQRHQRHQGAIRDCCRYAAVRAVLARLEASLVAPVDPEAVARDYANNAATGYAPGIVHPPYWFEYTDEQRTKRTAAMRTTLIARGIPVTPEVGK